MTEDDVRRIVREESAWLLDEVVAKITENTAKIDENNATLIAALRKAPTPGWTWPRFW